MNKKILFSVLILVALAGGGFWIYKVNKNKVDIEAAMQNQNTDSNHPNASAGLILYYSDGCPHCVAVKDYIKDNNIDSKVSINKKEVSSDRNNTNELMEKAASCGMAQDSIGVPFLWNDGKCITGDQDIISFLGKY